MGLTHKENESLKYYFNSFNNEKIYIEDWSNSLAINFFLYGIHMWLLWTRMVEMIPRLSYKEMTKIVAMKINVEDMASHHKIITMNHPKKRKTKEESINLQGKKFKSRSKK